MFHHIDIPIPIINRELPATPSDSRFYYYERVSPTFLSPDFVKWFEGLNFSFKFWSSIILFYAHPKSRVTVHTDIGAENFWALNCLLTPGDIDIKWCNAVGGELMRDKLDYIVHDINSPVIESTRMKNTLCRIAFPHTSINDSEQGAWFISIRAAPKEISWDKLCARFTKKSN